MARKYASRVCVECGCYNTIDQMSRVEDTNRFACKSWRRSCWYEATQRLDPQGDHRSPDDKLRAVVEAWTEKPKSKLTIAFEDYVIMPMLFWIFFSFLFAVLGWLLGATEWKTFEELFQTSMHLVLAIWAMKKVVRFLRWVFKKTDSNKDEKLVDTAEEVC